MKTSYYTSHTIEQQAEKFLDEIRFLRDKREHIRFDLLKAALLVLDMQHFFLDEDSHAFVPSAYAIIPNIQKLEKLFEEKKQPIVLTQHSNDVSTNHKTDRSSCQLNMKRWWHRQLTKANPKSALINPVKNCSFKLLEKSTYDAFFKTELEGYLKEQEISQVVITGVMTHLCCETTARSAFLREFDVFFAIDATATYNETFQLNTLYNLAHGFAVPMLTEEILRIIKS